MGRRQCAVMRGGADNVAEGRAPRGRPAQGLPPPPPHSQAVPAVADSGKITLPSVLRCPEPRAPGLSRRAHAEYGYAVPVAPAAADGRPCCRRRLGRPAGSCGRRGHAARHTARPQDVRPAYRAYSLLRNTHCSRITAHCSLLGTYYCLLNYTGAPPTAPTPPAPTAWRCAGRRVPAAHAQSPSLDKTSA